MACGLRMNIVQNLVMNIGAGLPDVWIKILRFDVHFHRLFSAVEIQIHFMRQNCKRQVIDIGFPYFKD